MCLKRRHCSHQAARWINISRQKCRGLDVWLSILSLEWMFQYSRALVLILTFHENFFSTHSMRTNRQIFLFISYLQPATFLSGGLGTRSIVWLTTNASIFPDITPHHFGSFHCLVQGQRFRCYVCGDGYRKIVFGVWFGDLFLRRLCLGYMFGGWCFMGIWRGCG